VEDARGIYRYEERTWEVLQKCALVSLGSCKDQYAWCSEEFGIPLMNFCLEK